MWPVPDLKAFLLGSWSVERSLEDRRRSIFGEYRGTADFTRGASCLLYEERGLLSFGSHFGPAEQRYLYDFHLGNARACVRFRDGRRFHDLDLLDGEALVEHNCDPDIYEGRFTVQDPLHWKSAWHVTGPRKDQEIVTLYTRLPSEGLRRPGSEV